MTPDPTINPNEVLADSPDITPPPEVQSLFDEADFDEGKYACKIDPPFVKLTSVDGKTVIKEVRWDRCGAWQAAFMRQLQETTTAIQAERDRMEAEAAAEEKLLGKIFSD